MSAQTTTLTTFDGMMKIKYADLEVEHSALKTSPALAMIPKDKNLLGKTINFPVSVGAGGGGAATISTAINNVNSTTQYQFAVGPSSHFQIGLLDGLAMEASVREGAFDDAMSFDIEDKMQMATQKLGFDIYGTGTGRVAQIASISASTITVTNPSDILGLRQGAVLVASTTDGGGSVESGNMSVSSVDFTAGTISVGSTYATGSVSTLAAGDYLYNDGDYGLRLGGFQGWIQGNSVSSATWYGVNRTVAPQFLAGWNVDGRSLSPEEAIQQAFTTVSQLGGQPKTVFMSLLDHQNLVRSLNTKVVYVDSVVKNGKFEVPFRGVSLNIGNSQVECYADVYCPVGKAFLLNLPDWKLNTIGGAPRFFGEGPLGDGLRMLRDFNSNNYQYRLGYYGNLVCYRPKNQAVIQMPAA